MQWPLSDADSHVVGFSPLPRTAFSPCLSRTMGTVGWRRDATPDQNVSAPNAQCGEGKLQQKPIFFF